MSDPESSVPACSDYDNFVFISYAPEDRATVHPILKRLHEGGFRVWHHDGTASAATVAGRIAACSILIVFVSKCSVASKNVVAEIEQATGRGKEILPVRLEPGDFSGPIAALLKRTPAIEKHALSDDNFRRTLVERLAARGLSADSAKKVRGVISTIGEDCPATLTVNSKGDGDKTYPLEKPRLVVGRDKKCDIQLDNLAISREHCAFSRRGEAYVVRDLNSANGTFINGKKITEHFLNDGDEIVVGQFKLFFKNHAMQTAPKAMPIKAPPEDEALNTYIMDGPKLRQSLEQLRSGIPAADQSAPKPAQPSVAAGAKETTQVGKNAKKTGSSKPEAPAKKNAGDPPANKPAVAAPPTVSAPATLPVAAQPPRPAAPSFSFGSFVGAIKSGLHSMVPKTSRANAPNDDDSVHFSLVSPTVMKPGYRYALLVWAYLESQKSRVLQLTRETPNDPHPRIQTKAGGAGAGGVLLARGTRVTARIIFPAMTLMEADDDIVWNGTPANASFSVLVPPTIEPGTHEGKILFLVEGLPVAKLHFVVTTGGKPGKKRDVQTHTRIYRSAFASYSSEDRKDVLARIQGIQKAIPGFDIFLDVASLRAGDKWQERVAGEIKNCDVLYLFWSKTASESKYVDFEWRTALSLNGKERIDPVPLSPPGLVPPPKELNDLHFNDWTLAYINSENWMKQQSE